MRIADLQRTLRPFVAAIPAAGLVLGFAAALFGASWWSGWIWAAGTVPIVLVLLLEIITSLRRGDIGLDIVAALSMTAALIFGEHLAAVVVALMYGGGQYLESFAERHARREMTDLLGRVPRTAIRHLDGALQEVAVEALEAGDRILVRQGDVVPVDGTVLTGVAVLDQSALTGESIPVQHAAGELVMSGSANVGAAFDLSATRRAPDSTYAGIVRLVEAAQRSRAPMSRLADRFAIVFLAVTLLLAGAAWLLSGDPIRAVAVMVIATPCPLILAVPVAIAAGLSRAAKQGILVKGGKALETLAQVRSLVIDKTGTLTHGRAQLAATRVAPGQSPDEILRVAASLDQASKHAIAQTLVEEARKRGLDLSVPTAVAETPGEGIEGELGGRRVIVGGLHFVAARTQPSKHSLLPPARTAGAIAVAVAIDSEVVGIMLLADELRHGTEVLLRQLRATGIERIVVASGDRRDVAETVTKGLSIDLVRSELTPDQKVLAVLSERKNGPVMMIGDGVNDAPALAAADIGLAMGANGAAAAAEAADIVLLVDQLDRVLAAVEIARRSRFIALQSVVVGLGLSMVGMVAAALGFLVPVEGAVLQELIDLAVIFNALRALSAGRSFGGRNRTYRDSLACADDEPEPP